MATVEALKHKKDIELLKTVLKQQSIRHYILFIIGCNTGLRIGDILRLKVSDFVTGERMTVRKHLIITEQKTDKVRQIAINNIIQKVIKIYLSHHSSVGDDYLFASRKGTNTPISCTQAYRILNVAASDCKIDINFGTHTMRKTWGYWTYKISGNTITLDIEYV